MFFSSQNLGVATTLNPPRIDAYYAWRLRISCCPLLLCCSRLELSGRKRRLTWEAIPRSIHDGIQSTINSSDCLVFDTNIAQLFADNGNLGINVTINMCWLLVIDIVVALHRVSRMVENEFLRVGVNYRSSSVGLCFTGFQWHSAAIISISSPAPATELSREWITKVVWSPCNCVFDPCGR